MFYGDTALNAARRRSRAAMLFPHRTPLFTDYPYDNENGDRFTRED
jgi:hypothetical protein